MKDRRLRAILSLLLAGWLLLVFTFGSTWHNHGVAGACGACAGDHAGQRVGMSRSLMRVTGTAEVCLACIVGKVLQTHFTASTSVGPPHGCAHVVRCPQILAPTFCPSESVLARAPPNT